MLESTSNPSSADVEVIVLAGGDTVDGSIRHLLPNNATVIAADSGLALAPILGLTVDLIIGDLDSVDPDQLAAARTAGADVERHPVDKDRTDLALALDGAMTRSPARITVVGGHGGRLDHLLANAALFAAASYADTRIVARMGHATLTVVRGGRPATGLSGTSGELVSLLPVHGAASGVTTDGLRFALDGDDLAAGS
ncbi:MAG: thiamine diphosphokinase, partial [Intrasporangiaceae bacterium]|nr:thiamine diphosphokinase [Intrasporangiaceae bacterium]